MPNRGASSVTPFSRVRGLAAPGLTQLASALLVAALVYLAFAIMFLLLSPQSQREPALAVLHIGSACSLLLFWRFVRWGKGKYDAFGAIMLLISAMLKLQAAIDALVYGARIDMVPATVPWPEHSALLFMKTEALDHFGTLILVAVWRLTVGDKVGEFSFLRNYRQVGMQISLLMYLGALGVEVLGRLGGLEFGALTQLSSFTYSFGVVSIFFVAARQRRRYVRILLALIMAAPMVLMALGGGMKEAMFFPLVPAALLYWFGFKGIAPKIPVIVFGLVLFGYSQLYVHYVRSVSWGRSYEVGTSELLGGFQKHLANTTISQGMDDMSARLNMTQSRAITVAIADARGFEPGKIFGPIPGSLVPRIFWPGKPVYQPGAEHTARILNTDIPLSRISSATAAGFFSELYLGGWYLGWLGGALAYGYLLARIQLFTLAQLRGFGHLGLSFTTAYWALRFQEKHIVYAYTSLIFTCIFLFLVIKSMSLLKTRRHQRTGS